MSRKVAARTALVISFADEAQRLRPCPDCDATGLRCVETPGGFVLRECARCAGTGTTSGRPRVQVPPWAKKRR